MIEFLLYYTPAFLIAYLITTKLWTKCALFNYINSKSSRGVITLFIVLGIFILLDILLYEFNLTKNISNVFLGLIIGAMIATISQIRYPKKS